MRKRRTPTVLDLIAEHTFNSRAGIAILLNWVFSMLDGPGWIDSERYDIDAKAEDAPGLAVMNGPMMQGLLEDRFKLKIHRESGEVLIYELTSCQGRPQAPSGPAGKLRCSGRLANHCLSRRLR